MIWVMLNSPVVTCSSKVELSVLEATDCLLFYSLFAVRSPCPCGLLSSAVAMNVAQVAVLVRSQ